MKRIIIIGASSGLGLRIASDFARMGWLVGMAARREAPMKAVSDMYPDHVRYISLDVTAPDATDRLNKLIDQLGGMDTLLYAAGCGWYNPEADPEADRHSVEVNVRGFTTIINAAYRYFRQHPGTTPGHIAAITSVAGTKGLGISASYCASKRYQWTYLQAIDQLARSQHANIRITDIRPGFVRTDLLKEFPTPLPLEMSIGHAATRIERAIISGRRVATIDRRWAIVTAIWRLIPDFLWPRLTIKLK